MAPSSFFVHPDLCEQVAANIGRPVPSASPVALEVDAPIDVSPALSMEITEPGPIAGRVIGMVVGDGVKRTSVDKVAQALTTAGAVLHVIGPRGGFIGPVEIHHTFHTCDSVMFDALVVDSSAAGALELDRKVGVMLQETYRHHKAIAAIGDAAAVLEVVGIDPEAPGVVTAPSAAKAFTKALIDAVGWHRHWERVV